MSDQSLSRYRDKRSAHDTPEPFSRRVIPATGRLFVVQQHHARHMHFDLRLEMDGTLRSWAVPKGPSADPADKRFAALVEDHPLDYADFEGRIPDGNYGAGHVIVWDRGTWTPLKDPRAGLASGKLLFDLHGFKLRGRWTLVRIKGRDTKTTDKDWLLIKEQDQWAQTPSAYTDDSVLCGMTIEEMREPRRKVVRMYNALKRLTRAKPAPEPVRCDPMLASAGEAHDRKDWINELKYDGYRLMIEKHEGNVTLLSRNGHDLTALFPEIVQPAARNPVDQFVIDGEVVVHDERGVPDFSLLQQRVRLADELQVSRAAIELPCTYWAFDALQILGFDLRDEPLVTRKGMLEQLLASHGALRYSHHIEGRGLATFTSALELGLEGIVSKRADSPYRSGRSDAWLKVRGERRADLVIAGWLPTRGANPPDGEVAELGALALAEYRDGVLTFSGRVGTGFDGRTRRELEQRLAKLAPGDPLVADERRVRWVEPRLVCEVSYREYTRDGHLRHPVFQRLRDDKSPRECTGRFADPPATPELAPAPEPEVAVTNADKVFYPELGFTKGDLVGYYEDIAPWMLPYLEDRPVVLTRFPDGIHGKSFYQKDAPDFVPDWLRREVMWSESTEREVNYFIVDNAAGLKYLANLGTIPIHVWHSRTIDLEHPDWCVLDLDPKGAPYAHVLELARTIGALADELALPAYPKTSGASGLHVLIPLARQLTHGQSRTLGELLARVVVARHPDIATIARALRSRGGKVYVDYLQNGHGQLLVAPFSARAEPSAGVSMPVKWSEVTSRLSNERFHLGNAVARMKRRADPMAPILTEAGDLERALTELGRIFEREAARRR